MKCVYCGKTIVNWRKSRGQKCCSRACYAALRRESRRGKVVEVKPYPNNPQVFADLCRDANFCPL